FSRNGGRDHLERGGWAPPTCFRASTGKRLAIAPDRSEDGARSIGSEVSMRDQPRRRPFSLAGLLGVVALCAIGFGALRAESDAGRAALLMMLLCGMLLAIWAMV